MFASWLISTLVIGGVLGYIVRSLRDQPQRSKPLPPGAGPPKNRAEAVRRVLKHLQRKTIAELAEGSAAVIEGTVRPIASVPPLNAPFSGTACIGYHLDMRAGWIDHDMLFAQLHEDARCADFEVEDATGVIRVVGAGLELAITDGPFTYWNHAPPHLAARIPHHVGPMTIEEGLLRPGDRILVCGVVTSELTATDYRDGKPVYTVRASPSFPLVASTDHDLFVGGDRPIAPEELHKRR